MKSGLNIFGKKAFLPVEVVYDCLEMSDTAQKMKFSIMGFFLAIVTKFIENCKSGDWFMYDWKIGHKWVKFFAKK